jgi:hypothetical protein
MTWENITTKQFYEREKVLLEYEDEFDRKLASIGILTGQTFDEVCELKMSEINALTKKYHFFLYEQINAKVVTGWKDYKFTIKLSDLQADQFIDFLETTKEDYTFKLHTILAILDTTKKDFAEKEADLLNCPITIVKGISDFFFRKYKLSPRIIQMYSLQQVEKMNQKIYQLQQQVEHF